MFRVMGSMPNPATDYVGLVANRAPWLIGYSIQVLYVKTVVFTNKLNKIFI